MSEDDYRLYTQPLDSGQHLVVAHVLVESEERADLLIEELQDWLTSEGGWQSKVH